VSPRRHLSVLAAALAAAVSGCAYFNGMYLANRYARRAADSERAGRLAEARDRWQQAATHAESLLAQHGRSRWAAAAQLVRGEALVHLEQYSDGVVALRQAVQRLSSREQRLAGFGLMGHAYLALGWKDSAQAPLDSAVEARSREVKSRALFDRGRLRLQLNQPEAARADLERSSDPKAPYELGLLEARLGDTAAAGGLYDALAGRKDYPEDDWRRALDSLAAAGASAHASALAERLAARPALSSGAQARLLLDDGVRRLASGDTAGAASRLQRAVSLAKDSLAGQAAAVALCRIAIAQAASDSGLLEPRGRLMELRQSGGNASRDAMAVLRLLSRTDSLAAMTTAPDAWWFLRAELLRDSLGAGHLAAVSFASMADRYPESPWTPKGLVAAIAAGYPAPDSLRNLLAARYGRSPYALAASATGEGSDSAYQALEDSLRRTLSVAAAGVPGAPARGRPGVVGAVEGDEPRARPAPRPPARPQPSGPPQPEPPE